MVNGNCSDVCIAIGCECDSCGTIYESTRRRRDIYNVLLGIDRDICGVCGNKSLRRGYIKDYKY